jgi:hypothetical protein
VWDGDRSCHFYKSPLSRCPSVSSKGEFEEMKGRTLWALIVAALVVVVAAGWFFLLRHSKGPLLRLKIVRQTVENGRQVVFFRVDVAGSRRITICDVERVIPIEKDGPAEPSDWALEILRKEGSPFQPGDQSKPAKDFWASMHQWPMWDPAKGCKEFGVLAPKTAAVWKLQVTAKMETPGLINRLRWMWGQRNILWQSGKPIPKIISETWLSFHDVEERMVESDLITNSVPMP